MHDNQTVAQSSTTNAPPNPINNYLALPGTGEVLAFTTNSGTYVPLHDRLGSTIGLVNSSNVLQTQYTYDPFGNVTTVGQASLYPYLFAGMEYDSSGLYHTQSRYYSPTFGRFLSADAGMPPNPFSYVGNDPVNAIDPSGMTAEFVSGATGMSPPPDGASGAADANPESGGLGGAVLAQGCPNGDCAIPAQSPNYSQGGLLGDLIGFLVSLFGGGGQPTLIPRGYRRVAHYPAMSFITDSQADLQQFTPDLNQKSAAIEAPVLPTGSVDENIREAKAHSRIWWINKVRDYGAWDFKRYPGGWRKWDYAGNFNYGATGAAQGLSNRDLLSAGGILQMNAPFKYGVPYLEDPYGESKAAEIRAGEEYYRQQQMLEVASQF